MSVDSSTGRVVYKTHERSRSGFPQGWMPNQTTMCALGEGWVGRLAHRLHSCVNIASRLEVALRQAVAVGVVPVHARLDSKNTVRDHHGLPRPLRLGCVSERRQRAVHGGERRSTCVAAGVFFPCVCVFTCGRALGLAFSFFSRFRVELPYAL